MEKKAIPADQLISNIEDEATETDTVSFSSSAVAPTKYASKIMQLMDKSG